MLDQNELQQCEIALRSLSPQFDWLLNSPDLYIGVSEISRGYKSSIATVRKWVDDKLIPGAFVDPATNQVRIPKNGLIVFFGRLVMPTFRATA